MKDNKKSFIINKFKPDELKGLDKLQQNIKESFFGVFYILLKDDTPSYGLHMLLITFNLIQLVIFTFEKGVADSWNNKAITDQIFNVVTKLDIVYYIDPTSINTYLIVFYLCLFLLILMLINFIYVYLLFSRSIFTLSWPVYTLKYTIRVFSSMFFIPYLKLYFSVFNCMTAADGTLVLYFDTSIECFNGFHFLHIFIAVISIIFILVTQSAIISTFYEYSSLFNNKLAKKNSNPDYLLFISKTVLVIIFTFMSDKSNSIVLIIVQFLLSLACFVSIYENKPYYNRVINVFNTIIISLWFWTNLVLFGTNLFQLNQYSGSIYIWICGIPLIIFALIFNSVSQEFKMIQSVCSLLDLESPVIVEKHISFLLGLLVDYSTKRENEVIIKGFVRNHEDTCVHADCPLKLAKRSLESNNEYSIFNNLINSQMVLFISRIYLFSLHKFPNSVLLRISYALFLYQNQKLKVKAKQELEQAEKSSPGFNEQFIIFRFKKLIIEDLDMNQNQSEVLDIASSIAYESHFRQCQLDILNVAKLFLEFWTTLASQNSTPDITRLNELSLKVNETIKNVHSHWKRMHHYKPNNPKALKIYASFHSDLLNNKEKAKEILALSKETADKKIAGSDSYNLDEDYSNGQCVLICSAEAENYGVIVKASSNACKIFGYLPDDLINGRPLDDLFADCYSSGVSNFIHDLTLNWGDDKSKQEYIFYIKTKQHRTSPAYIKILDPTKAIGDKMHLKLCIKPVDNVNEDLKEFARLCYFIISQNLSVSIASDSTLEFLTITHNTKQVDTSNIINILPELLKNFDRFDNTEGKFN